MDGCAAVSNNAHRKVGPSLPTIAGRVYGGDPGVCFSREDKRRTLLWEWRGDLLDDEAMEVLFRLRAELEGELGDALRDHLTRGEVAAATRRVDRLLTERTYPMPSQDWPAIPWPPF